MTNTNKKTPHNILESVKKYQLKNKDKISEYKHKKYILDSSELKKKYFNQQQIKYLNKINNGDKVGRQMIEKYNIIFDDKTQKYIINQT